MKNIKIATLTKTDDLKLKINTQKNIQLAPEKANEVISKLSALIPEHRAKGMDIIFGQSIDGVASVSTQVELKNKKSYFFPEPNPVHLFYSNSIQHFENSKKIKEEFEKVEHADYIRLFGSFNSFFNEISTGVIMLCTSIEAFINQHIPENYVFDIDGKIYSKKDVEWMDLKKKIKEYLPILFNIKFQVSNHEDYKKIIDLSQLRNDLIHLKTDLSQYRTFYDNLFARLIDINTDDYVDASFVFMNTFRPNYLIYES